MMKDIANSGLAPKVIEELEKLVTKVSDIRFPMTVRADIENDVRRAVCSVIEEELIKPIKRLKGDVQESKDDYT